MDGVLLDGDPTQVARYRILRRLGEGGMGVVYLAETPLGERVAIKLIHRHLAADVAFRRRFRREVDAARRVARFSTAAVLDAEVEGHTAYLVTEYVPGPTLLEAVRTRGPLSGSALEGLAVSMAMALQAIHAADVVHRDLKPSNVLLSPVGPKVIDFGLAQLADAATQSIAVLGTPAYMSPEQARRGKVTAASDIFSWGGVVTFAATASPPFGTGSGQDVLYRVVHDEPELPPIGGVLGELVARALAKDPAKRPTAGELVDALANGHTRNLTDPLPPPPARRARVRLPLRRVAVWAGAAALGLVAAGALAAVQGDDGSAVDPPPPVATGENPLRGGAVALHARADTDAARQARIWEAEGRAGDAALMRALAEVPQATWLGKGTPDEVGRIVRDTLAEAGRQGRVPVFVTDFVPMRDCWNGGAESGAAYRAWIDGVAGGIGDGRAVVALEPAGLSRAPGTPECPRGGEQALRQRLDDLTYAVTKLGGLARTAVYLDGGLSDWPSLEASAQRLAEAGIARADGFYLNLTGYRPTPESIAWGVRLSKCVHLRLSSPEAACSADALDAVPDDTPALPRFVIDTSRNGKGEWRPPPGRFPDPQEWCNPPGRGAGARPTTATGHPLADALLWLNSPGYSSMRCLRGTAGPADPVYGIVTPEAGQWWPDLALDRARNAVPPLTG
ncbi:glycoside hydrolase family 6 protein [Thermopolyspora sp. NPDC052614]|uniref:glycoside hydrolase family 6 protein n=1 Tax=Thermopolyspora sp. NPDC052614 TaxID=3155682 RepID=UPI00343CE231